MSEPLYLHEDQDGRLTLCDYVIGFDVLHEGSFVQDNSGLEIASTSISDKNKPGPGEWKAVWLTDKEPK